MAEKPQSFHYASIVISMLSHIKTEQCVTCYRLIAIINTFLRLLCQFEKVYTLSLLILLSQNTLQHKKNLHTA